MANTIAVISTALGNGAISIVRLSGENALSIASKLFFVKGKIWSPKPNLMSLGYFISDKIEDKCLAVYFKAPLSYTGEDMVEIHSHGGNKVAPLILSALIDNGCTLADKGEFTRRAFMNGKLSLSEAEGVIDMINAESEAGLRAGFRLMTGRLSRQVISFQDKVLDITAELEASLDYPDEMEEEARENGENVVRNMFVELATLLESGKNAKYIKNGINVAIIGLPNSGKSSLLNAITGTRRAIVTEIPGTTRDIITEKIEFEGLTINLIDTAGIRATEDRIEKIGVDLALEEGQNADIVILLTENGRELKTEEDNLLDKFKDKKIIIVYNKIDIYPDKIYQNGIYISAKNNIGIDELLTKIQKTVLDNNFDINESCLTNLRHIQAIERAYISIASAKDNFATAPTECVLIDLKSAYTALGEVTGNTADESIIDRIFAKFCLGK